MNPYTLDIRSIAAFRILLGAYFLYDIYFRLCLGKYDWAWYTSQPEDRSYVADNDTPHQAPLHKLWFYRGSLLTQQILFSLTTVLVMCYLLGLGQRWGVLKILLFVLLTSMQCRHMTGTDGSDLYSRLLFLWTIFLPVDQIWSVDSWRGGKRPQPPVVQVQGLACLGLTLQIAFMYLGTFMNRIEMAEGGWRDCGWLPPRLDAVHYILSGGFSVRNHALNRFIQTNPAVSRTMTAGASAGELLGPLGVLCGGRFRHYFALFLCQLHLGMLITMNLPNWQTVGMIVHIIFVPSTVWDRLLGLQTTSTKGNSDTHHKKTDGDTSESVVVQPSSKTLRTNLVSRSLQMFFFGYAIFNFLANRSVIPKWDNGDIGEGLRISQNWIMFGKAGERTHNTFLTGYDRSNPNFAIDILRYLADRRTVHAQLPDLRIIPVDMTDRFPSPRFERALYTWASRPRPKSMEKFCATMCTLLNEEDNLNLGKIELRIQHVKLNPPGSNSRRFNVSTRRDTVAYAICEEDDDFPSETVNARLKRRTYATGGTEVQVPHVLDVY